MARVLMLLSVIFVSVYVTEQADFLQQDFIDNINKRATTWKAGMNFDPNTPKEHMLKLLGSKGVQIPSKSNMHMYKTDDPAYENSVDKIPKRFDAREKWTNCKTIGVVRDQGKCGSGWAVASSSAFADRLCIATDGDFDESLSAEEIAFCCHSCGFGCDGGSPIKAWRHFKEHGLVTGGDYNSSEGCQPYRVPPCPYDDDGNNACDGRRSEISHICRRRCYGNTSLHYIDDHRYTRDYYYLSYESIQKDVMTYGPIEASFEVYEDFFNYKSGVYEKDADASYMEQHAVKLIGWGVQEGIPYWLMVNSWNEGWGDNGLFKIRRGINECGVDNSTTGGVPAKTQILRVLRG